MEHAASPSLISLGLTTDTSSEGSSFRWGLASSCVLHALVIFLAMFIRFQSESEKPLRAIEVALISLPNLSTPTTRPTPSPQPAPTPIKKAVEAPKKITPPPPSTPAQPVEETLPPLPTETASERLSEALGGAINSILIPQKRETAPSTIPSQEREVHPAEDQSPLIDNLHLPSAPPTIARPRRLQPTEPLRTPSATIPPPTEAPRTEPAPVKAPAPPTPPTLEKIQPEIKPAPALPSLSEVTPFTKPEQNTIPTKTPETATIEESLRRNIPDIQTPPTTPRVPKRSRKPSTRKSEPLPSTPKISAPAMTNIPKSPPPPSSVPTQPKMSETVKKLMEGLKSTTRTPVLEKIPQQSTRPSPTVTPVIPRPPSAIDQRIAKLSIPEVTPAESIKQRLQLLEVQATGNPGGSSSKASEGKNRYLAMVEDRIDSQWVAPPLVASTPVVVLSFHIARSGEISRIYIAESSGHAHYDAAAQRAVQAVNPLPVFPADISDSFFDVKYRFIKD